MKRISVLLPVLVISSLLGGCGGDGSDQNLTTERVTITGLGVEESQAGVDHPLHVKLTAVSETAIDEVDVAVGLMQKVAADAAEAEKQAAYSCMLGLTRIQNLQANIPASSFAEFVVHQDCLGPNGSPMDYNVFVIVNPHGEVDETAEGEDANNIIVFNEAESGRPENAACVSEGSGDAGCIFDVRIVPNPGLNLELTQIELESPTLLLHPTEDSPHTVDGSNEHNYPNLEADVLVRAYGVPPDAITTLPAGTQISYSICAAAENCLPLTIYSNPHEPAGHKPAESFDAFTGHTDISLSHALYAEGATLAALLPGGQWAAIDNFLVRACLTTTDDTHPGNNCKTTSAARLASGKMASLGGQAKAYESNIDFSRSNNKAWGTGTSVRVNSDFSISNIVDKAGAHIANTYITKMNGGELAHFEGSAESLSGGYGSGLSFKVSAAGTSLYSYSKTGTKLYYPVYDWWRVARKYCYTDTTVVYLLKVSITNCATGQIGFKGILSNNFQDLPQASQKNGNAGYSVEEAVDFDGAVSGSVNLEFARSGVDGAYAVIHENYNSSAGSNWELIRDASMVGGADARTIWNCSSLSGSVKVYSDIAVPDLCSAAGIPYPCRSWSRAFNKTSDEWRGESWPNVMLLNRTAASVVIMSPW